MIVEEIARQFGLKNAYDLVKIKDTDGKVTLGVLSKSTVDIENGEQLISLRDIIGDEPATYDNFS